MRLGESWWRGPPSSLARLSTRLVPLLLACFLLALTAPASPASAGPEVVSVTAELHGWGLLSEYDALFNATMWINGTIVDNNITLWANLTFWNATFSRSFYYNLTGKIYGVWFYLSSNETLVRFVGLWNVSTTQLVVAGASAYAQDSSTYFYITGLKTEAPPVLWEDLYDLGWALVRFLYHGWKQLLAKLGIT